EFATRGHELARAGCRGKCDRVLYLIIADGYRPIGAAPRQKQERKREMCHTSTLAVAVWQWKGQDAIWLQPAWTASTSSSGDADFSRNRSMSDCPRRSTSAFSAIPIMQTRCMP